MVTIFVQFRLEETTSCLKEYLAVFTLFLRSTNHAILGVFAGGEERNLHVGDIFAENRFQLHEVDSNKGQSVEGISSPDNEIARYMGRYSFLKFKKID